MFDILNNIKTAIVGLLISITPIISPAATISKPLPTLNPANDPRFIELATKSAKIELQTSENQARNFPSRLQKSPLPLNGENYIYIQGTYSYIGNSIKYLALVPRKGGSFSFAINGACQAQGGGNFEGGNGGKISGRAGGFCQIFGQKIEGSTDFKGKLYPETKTIELDINNSPVNGFKIQYN